MRPREGNLARLKRRMRVAMSGLLFWAPPITRGEPGKLSQEKRLLIEQGGLARAGGGKVRKVALQIWTGRYPLGFGQILAGVFHVASSSLGTLGGDSEEVSRYQLPFSYPRKYVQPARLSTLSAFYDLH